MSLILALVLTGALACDRNVESFREGEEPSQPDLARIFPAPEGGIGAAAPTDAGGGGQVARQALPPSRAESGGATAAATPTQSTGAAAPIAGVIELAPSLAGSSPSGAILFIIARPDGASGGPPLAVLRVANPVFPLPFTIGPENVMIPSMKFAGSISLSARLDADGNAMTRGVGDISSSTQEGLSPGATGVEIVLSDQS
jgi:hypothetical protein